MKLRLGFVSNSSSSSFTCLVCEANYSGRDATLEDAAMTRCVNDHVFCDHHAVAAAAVSVDEMRARLALYVKPAPLAAYSDEQVRRDYDYWIGQHKDSAPMTCCPICQFVKASIQDIAAYYLKKAGVKREEIVALLKAEFGEYAKLKEFVKS